MSERLLSDWKTYPPSLNGSTTTALDPFHGWDRTLSISPTLTLLTLSALSRKCHPIQTSCMLLADTSSTTSALCFTWISVKLQCRLSAPNPGSTNHLTCSRPSIWPLQLVEWCSSLKVTLSIRRPARLQQASLTYLRQTLISKMITTQSNLSSWWPRQWRAAHRFKWRHGICALNSLCRDSSSSALSIEICRKIEYKSGQYSWLSSGQQLSTASTSATACVWWLLECM